MNENLRIHHLLTDEVKEIPFDRANERLFLSFANADGFEKVMRIYAGDNSLWVGVDGYGEPENKDDEATQVLVDVYHMDLPRESESSDGVHRDAFARVVHSIDQDHDDSEIVWFEELRLLDLEEAFDEIEKVLKHKHLQSTEQRIRNILERTRRGE